MKADLTLANPVTPSQGDNVGERLRFWRRSVVKHKWGALGVALVVVLLTAYAVFSLTPIYRGTTTILLEFNKPKVVSIEEVYGGLGANREFMQTQVEILKSQELLKKLAVKLKLVQKPIAAVGQELAFRLPFIPDAWQPARLAGWFRTGPAVQPTGASESQLVEAAAGAIGRELVVQLVRGSQLVRISFESPDKELAAQVPNGLAEAYIENDLEARLQMTQKAHGWINERLGGLRQKLASSEQQLQSYRERERIVDVKGLAMSGAGKQLEEVTTRLFTLRQRRLEAENAYNQLQSALKSNSGLEAIPAIQQNATIQKFRDAELEAQRKVAELSQRYGKEHPRMVTAEAELRSARENARKQIDLVVTGITREYEVTRANEASLESVANSVKGSIQNVNRKEFQLGVLEREVAANRQMYEMFLNRFRETNIGPDLQSAAARVIDPATIPTRPVKPAKTEALLIALVLGLMLGVMLAFLLEYLDNTVKNSDDVEQKLGMPLVGVLQQVGKGTDLRRAVLEDARSAFSESIRTIRTSVMMSDLDNPHKILLVTSSVPEEGKTTVAMNLAFAFAQVNKVCLIDADMRRPSIARSFGMDLSAPGLSNMVAGTEQASKCMHLDKKSGVLVIPAGDVPPNPQELLASRRFNEVIKKLQELFDVVIIDSPPIQLMSDALVLSSHANAVMYVVKADSTPYQVAKGGIDRLRKVGAPVLGVILNQLDMEKADKYYGYGKYSAYGRGYDYYGYGAQKTA